MKRALISLIAGAAFLAAPISAIADNATAPLLPGGVAGVNQAQGLDDVPVLWWLGGGVILGTFVLLLTKKNNAGTPVPVSQPTNSTTTTTTTP